MISIFDLFKIGIGPSSSHTVGPMKAAEAFVTALDESQRSRLKRLQVTLLGSLAWTGRGHGTDKAVMLGLSGFSPESVVPDDADRHVGVIAATSKLILKDGTTVHFDPVQDIVFKFDGPTPVHPNTIRFAAFDQDSHELKAETWYSLGGGFVQREGEVSSAEFSSEVPFDYRSAAELIEMCDRSGLSIAQAVLANEAVFADEALVHDRLDRLVAVMFDCIDRGMRTDGELPGGLKVKRRAPSLHARLLMSETRNVRHSIAAMDYASLYAIAVNEENAAGGRVVTAPTNGAAGVIPAVLRYYTDHCEGTSKDGVRIFLLTSAAVGALCKMNASISGAEVGCQGEVGVACSMAAAGLAAALGGSCRQIENAAEIGMEHHLGMTCDPIGGLVQIPCIERNAFGAIKAINAASLALSGDGSHHVTLDQVIRTMRDTGADMQTKYKETSRGGLAVSVPDC
ncbi:L-serine ammonia-lyase [Afipia massiliensis]|uniref:L-serine dehydratase n=1 Tax=Afipia massiliensis TaxID=211460 RepID=A0A4U6BTH0_9BRAD|nr:L-serine ammonia-lyase [Afipia massiliensis]TKT73980.1 L-serine ammonia-lyase [Afipia massiliensis]